MALPYWQGCPIQCWADMARMAILNFLPILRGKAFSFCTIEYDVSCRFFVKCSLSPWRISVLFLICWALFSWMDVQFWLTDKEFLMIIFYFHHSYLNSDPCCLALNHKISCKVYPLPATSPPSKMETGRLSWTVCQNSPSKNVGFDHIVVV